MYDAVGIKMMGSSRRIVRCRLVLLLLIACSPCHAFVQPKAFLLGNYPNKASASSNQHIGASFSSNQMSLCAMEGKMDNGTTNSMGSAIRNILAAFTLALATCQSPAFAMDGDLNSPASRRYWSIIESGNKEEIVRANEALIDYGVGTINTMYYDNSGGAFFTPRDFYGRWRTLRDTARGADTKTMTTTKTAPSKSTRTAASNTVNDKTNDPSGSSSSSVPKLKLDTREGAVEALKWVVSNLDDPFSSYLTREELRKELESSGGRTGFLGLGAVVESPTSHAFQPAPFSVVDTDSYNKRGLLVKVGNLPMISAVGPDSPAERAGLTVGDRIVSIGNDRFLGASKEHVNKVLSKKYVGGACKDCPDLTIAKPVWRTLLSNEGEQVQSNVVVGYRTSKIKLSEISFDPIKPKNGDAYVHYEMLNSGDSILDNTDNKVGYIRLTRFSRASTAGFLRAVEDLEAQGAQSYIIDLRNNYGGIIQEAMLLSSTLLRDPHAVLCYTMNSRGGFTPHDAEEFIVDKRYPGYLLSSESKGVTINQVRRESPAMFEESGVAWVPPSSFASLHEQTVKRGIHVGFAANDGLTQLKAQKKLVLLINEGTASSAEVFASSLHDNGRTVALVGTKTFGKGLIQHTFPMPDGGGLRLTVAEYLTPTLHHVTNVGSARFDKQTGELVGGGIRPDVTCDTQQGIPAKTGADICVSTALDALEDAETRELMSDGGVLQRVGGRNNDGTGTRKAAKAGVVKMEL